MAAILEHAAGPQKLVGQAVSELRSSFERGETRSVLWRREQLLRLRALVTQNEDALLHALEQDLGKGAVEARLTEVAFVVHECDRALRSLRRWMRPERVATPLALQPGRSSIVSEPLGVVLVIAPWNYPIQLALSPLVGALAAGNAAVLKPSEVSGASAEILGKLVPRYLDPSAVQLVQGGAEESKALLRERFDHIFYTGNGRVAREVMRAAARNLTPVTLELGGKSPCLVTSSAHLELAARRIAWGKFLNAGQTCVAPDYVLVDAALEERFLAALERAVRAFYGDDPRLSADFGRIVNARHHERLEQLLEGQQIALGGQSNRDALYLAPTVVVGARDRAPLMREEIFGPILPVRPVSDLDEALRFVAARPKPLALYVFAEDRAVQRRVIAEASAGGVCVNGTVLQLANAALPFGGVGASGMGAYHGRASFDVFSHRKSVYERATWVDLRLLYPPYGRWKAGLLRRLG